MYNKLKENDKYGKARYYWKIREIGRTTNGNNKGTIGETRREEL